MKNINVFVVMISSVLLISCGGDTSSPSKIKKVISEEKIKLDLTGAEIGGTWSFDASSEFVDIMVNSEKIEDNLAELKVDMILEDKRSKRLVLLYALLVYEKPENEWKFIKASELIKVENPKFRNLGERKIYKKYSSPHELAAAYIESVKNKDFQLFLTLLPSIDEIPLTREDKEKELDFMGKPEPVKGTIMSRLGPQYEKDTRYAHFEKEKKMRTTFTEKIDRYPINEEKCYGEVKYVFENMETDKNGDPYFFRKLRIELNTGKICHVYLKDLRKSAKSKSWRFDKVW